MNFVIFGETCVQQLQMPMFNLKSVFLLLFKASAKIGTFSDSFHSNVHEKIALGMLKI